MSAILELPTSPTEALETTARPLKIAIAGNPNAGKTSLFNALTGLRQKVANYPGVTVESKTGDWAISPGLPAACLIDLPGLYSLDATSLDEEIARDILLSRKGRNGSIDAIVVVVDATNLVRNLYLATQLIETGKPGVIALTMFDLAERHKSKIDVVKLSGELGVPVVPVVAKEKRGLNELAQAVMTAAKQKPAYTLDERLPVTIDPKQRQSNLIQRYARIERIVSDATEVPKRGRSTSELIDRYVTHPVLGPVILLLVLLVVFQSIFSWANLPMTLIENVVGSLGGLARLNLPAGLLTDLLVNGVIAGVGGVLVFLPQILLLFCASDDPSGTPRVPCSRCLPGSR